MKLGSPQNLYWTWQSIRKFVSLKSHGVLFTFQNKRASPQTSLRWKHGRQMWYNRSVGTRHSVFAGKKKSKSFMACPHGDSEKMERKMFDSVIRRNTVPLCRLLVFVCLWRIYLMASSVGKEKALRKPPRADLWEQENNCKVFPRKTGHF